MRRRPSPLRDASDDRPWMNRQKQILLSLAVFLAGCALISRSNVGGITNLRQQGSENSLTSKIRRNVSQRIRKHISQPQSRQPPSLRPDQNRNMGSSFLSAFDVIKIPLNTMATMYDDLISIEHLPAFSRIDVRLRDGARCPRPYLMGRLSGPALIMLQDWKWSPIRNQNNTNTTLITGHYQAPESGQYHFEIIAVHCHDFLHNMKQKGNIEGGTNKGPETWDLEIDQTVCMEDPWKHRLTEQTASIAVDHTVGTLMRQSRIGPSRGYWRNKGLQQQHQGARETQVTPLFTRFHSTKGKFSGEIVGSTSTRGDYFHARRYSPSEITQKIREEKLDELKLARICLVGSSQSRHQQQLFRQRINELLDTHNKTDTSPILTWGHVESPSHVTQEFARNLVLKQHCRKVVLVGITPWPATKGGMHGPMRVGDFYHSVNAMLSNLVNLRGSLADSHPLEVYIVSLRYHSLDAAMTSCPPSDWRSPPLIDGYNAAVAKACDDLGGTQQNVTFVDTRPLANPMWDFADKGNPVVRQSDDGSSAESLQIVQAVLGLESSDSEMPGGRTELEIAASLGSKLRR